jgi:hypothetical protein
MPKILMVTRQKIKDIHLPDARYCSVSAKRLLLKDIHRSVKDNLLIKCMYNIITTLW